MSKPTDLWDSILKIQQTMVTELSPHLDDSEDYLMKATWLSLWDKIKEQRYHTYVASNITNNYYH